MDSLIDYDDDGYPIIAIDEKLAVLNSINEFLVPLLKCKTQPASLCDKLEEPESYFRVQAIR